jgi:hypothetical protein
MTGSLFVTDWEVVDELPFCGVPTVVGSRAISLCTLDRRKRKRGIDRLETCGEINKRSSLIDACVEPSYAMNALIRVSMDVRRCRPELHCAGDTTPMICFRRLNIVNLRLN